MADDDTLVFERGSSPEAEALLTVYKAVMAREVQRQQHLDLDQARVAALAAVAGKAVADERARIAAELMRRSMALDPHRERPAEDPLVEGLHRAGPWKWLRYGIARAVYRVLAEMVHRDQV